MLNRDNEQAMIVTEWDQELVMKNVPVYPPCQRTPEGQPLIRGHAANPTVDSAIPGGNAALILAAHAQRAVPSSLIVHALPPARSSQSAWHLQDSGPRRFRNASSASARRFRQTQFFCCRRGAKGGQVSHSSSRPLKSAPGCSSKYRGCHESAQGQSTECQDHRPAMVHQFRIWNLLVD